MPQILTSVTSSFDAHGNATLVIPNGAEIVSFKFYEGDASDVNQEVGVVFIVDDPQTTPGTHKRMFQLLPDGAPLPDNFKEYKAGPLPYGPSKLLVHCVEIMP